MNARLQDAFRRQAEGCHMLGSPFMGRLMSLFAERLAPGSSVADRLLSWDGDVSSNAHSVPLRIAGALHGLILSEADAGLAAVYPPQEAPDDALWAEILRVFRDHEARLHAWLDLPPQTNEVRRSVALIPAALTAIERFGLPLTLSELGASGGLNLGFDRFTLDLGPATRGAAESDVRLAPDWSGPLPPDYRIVVKDRGGVDLNPLDPRAPDQALRLLAYLWPDQPDRLRLTRAAMALATARADAGDAAAWLEDRLSQPRPGTCHMIYHTIAWQYFPSDTQTRCTAAIAAAGAAASADAPIAHFSMEADGDKTGAAMVLRLWPGEETLQLGRVDFHGRWVEWRS